MRARRRRPASWPAAGGCPRRCGCCGAMSGERSGARTAKVWSARVVARRARSAAARSGRRRSRRETRPSGRGPRRRPLHPRPDVPARAVGRQRPDAGVLAHGPCRTARVDAEARGHRERVAAGQPSASARSRRRRRDIGVDVRARERSARAVAGVERGDLRGLADLDDGHARVYGCRARAVSSVHPFATTTISFPSGSPARMPRASAPMMCASSWAGMTTVSRHDAAARCAPGSASGDRRACPARQPPSARRRAPTRRRRTAWRAPGGLHEAERVVEEQRGGVARRSRRRL